MDVRNIALLSTRVGDTWSAEERAEFMGLDLRALRRSIATFTALGLLFLVAATFVTVLGYTLLSPPDEISFAAMWCGLVIGAVVGVALSVCLALLVGSHLALVPPMLQQSMVVATSVAGKLVTLIGAHTLSGDALLTAVALGLAGWSFLEPAWQHQVLVSGLRRAAFPRRALAIAAAQRSELGFSGRATFFGFGVAREVIGAVSRGVIILCFAALLAFSDAVALLALLLWLLADLADLFALTTHRRRLVSVVPTASAILLVVGVALVY